MAITQAAIARTKRDWQRFAGDQPIEVEVIKGFLYAYGSELACLRIYYHYRRSNPDEVRAQYSENLKTWFFCLETRL